MIFILMPPLNPVNGIQELTANQEDLVRGHLEEVMASRPFTGCRRAQDLLRFIVEQALAGKSDSLRERMIGAEMFNRPINYDTANDSVVRVKVTELRKKLAQFYLESDFGAVIRIEVPPGSYVPKFIFESLENRVSAALQTSPSWLPSVSANPVQEIPAATTSPESGKDISGLWGQFRDKWRLALGVLIGICIGVILTSAGLKVWRSHSNFRPEIQSIAVLPFENLLGNAQQDYIADGMTEELIEDLGQLSGLRVISRTSAMSYKGTHKELPEIARELSVTEVVEGSVLRNGTQMQVIVRLIDAKTDRPVWEESFNRKSTNVMASEEDVAQAIANELNLAISPRLQSHLDRTASVKNEAEDLYLQGMLDFHANNCGQAMGHFQKAIHADPSIASAYAALASCYGLLGDSGKMAYIQAFSKQKLNAERAIQLDDSLSEGHAEMADALAKLDWDWPGAEKELKRALLLNPSSATAHEHYGDFLLHRGDADSAIKEARIAVKLDPESSSALNDLAYIYFFSRHYDQALALLQEATTKDPDLRPDAFAFGDVYVQKGMYKEAISEFQQQGDNPHALGHLGNAYARAGQTVAARRILAQLERRFQTDGIGGYEIALIYTALDQKDQAFTWLERSIDKRDRGLLFLKVDPLLDPLRSDPRFNLLVRRTGLTPNSTFENY